MAGELRTGNMLYKLKNHRHKIEIMLKKVIEF